MDRTFAGSFQVAGRGMSPKRTCLGLDLGTFGRRLALGGCRVARLAGIEDCDECVYGGDQAN
jgi:hypothetical protein